MVHEDKKSTYVVITNQNPYPYLFFDDKDTVQFEIIKQGQTVNQHYYLDVLSRLRDADPKKRPKQLPLSQ